MADQLPEIFIPMFEFDPKRLRVRPAVTNSMKKEGGGTVEWTTSPGVYLDDDGNECEPYFEFPEQFCFGFNIQYTMGKPEETENIKGMQVCYSLTSMNTIDSPTKEEKYAFKVLDALYELAWKTMKKECSKPKDERIVPAPTYSSYVTAKADNDPSSAIKPVYDHPNTPESKDKQKKEKDASKPKRSYIRLLTRGTGADMRPLTIVHGPGDKKVSAFKYLDTKGLIHPVVSWPGIYWGAHGRNPYGGSVQLKLAECNFTPQGDGVPKRRMLGKNTAPVEEDDSSGSDEEFPHPGGENSDSSEGSGDDKDPLKQLQNSGSGTDSESEEKEESEEEEPPKPPPKKTKAKAKPKAKAKASAAEKRKAMMAARKKKAEK